ncbi:MAG: TlpA disulfide reductase family protein [Bacteroidota bacterium]
MKHYLLAFPLLAFIGCAPDSTDNASAENEVNNTVILNGTLANHTGGLVKLYNPEGEVADSAELSEQGDFALQFEVEEPGYYRFKYKEYATLYLNGGDSLHMTLDMAEFDESLTFSGRGAGPSQYIIARLLLEEGMSSNLRELLALEVEEFITKTDSTRLAYDQHLEQYTKDYPNLDADFLFMEQARNVYDWAYNRQLYPQYHARFAQKESYEAPADYFTFAEELNLEDERYLKLGSYNKYVTALVEKAAQDKYADNEEFQAQDHWQLHAQFEMVPTVVTNQTIREKFLFDMLHNQIRYQGIENLQALVDAYHAQSQDAENKATIDKVYGEWQALVAGNEAPDFEAVDTEGNAVKLSDLRGKYVYIDAWATWCGPCKAEIPHLEKLQEEFTGKNITFVSVSIDDTKEPWDEWMAEKEMGGTQLFVDGAWKSPFARAYLIRSIPRFLLIDPQGKIIDSNAERPSGDIAKVLAELEGIEA